MRYGILLLATFGMTACRTPGVETTKSRTYLNCVYHQHYELGKTLSTAEAKCR